MKQHLPADIFYREQDDAAVISLRILRLILESTEKCLPAGKEKWTEVDRLTEIYCCNYICVQTLLL